VSAADRTVIDRALRARSLPAAFIEKSAADPRAAALRMFGASEVLSWGDWRRRAAAVAGGLHAVGVRRGDRVALLLGTRMEFHIADMGALILGAVPFSLYVTSPAIQLREITENAEPRVLITEASLVEKARELIGNGQVRLVVVEPEAAGPGELSLAALEDLAGEDDPVEDWVARAASEDLCTLVYTSGTTGAPKGVQFRHGAMMACLDSIRQRFDTTTSDRAISYLPMAHIAERIFGHYAAFLYGYEVTSLPELDRLGEALRGIRPTRFFGVPRVYEKLLAGLHRHVEESPDRDALRGAWAARLARVRIGEVGAWPAPGPDTADHEALRAVAALTGLEQAHFLAVAGAPSSLEMLEELTALGLPINEFYGSSETIITTASPPEAIRLGAAGKAFSCVRMRLADDGEILVAGPTVTPGYFRDPERTAESFTPDGWFMTGDVGTFDEDGYLRIVDRKKALIINSAGKNMSPANIEQAIKGGEPLIAQAVAFGDRRPYNVALLVLDPDGVATFTREHGPGQLDEAVAAAVARGNERLSRVEQIKRFRVIEGEWYPGGDELTPTSKLRRREIATKYEHIIDALYDA
jgi:long-subunit acyl-CoA synthetase (AMP-forming)